jgi:hypothetical protein
VGYTKVTRYQGDEEYHRLPHEKNWVSKAEKHTRAGDVRLIEGKLYYAQPKETFCEDIIEWLPVTKEMMHG